jgi:hypothetical protein
VISQEVVPPGIPRNERRAHRETVERAHDPGTTLRDGESVAISRES